MLQINQILYLAFPIMLILSTFCAAESDTESSTEYKVEEKLRNLEDFEEPKGNYFEAFTTSFTSVLLAEIGDKTFWIAAIMSLSHSRLIVTCGAILALSIMTFISCAFGFLTHIIPLIVTYYIAIALFFIFGVKMIYDGCKMKQTAAQEQIDEVQTVLQKREDQFERNVNSMEMSRRSKIRRTKTYLKLRVFGQAFTMTFLSEWGDRSQFTTIAMAASMNIYGVASGAILAHIICTFIAVIAGRLVAYKISVRIVTFFGGFVFIAFAFYGLILPPDDLS